jgi:multidrug resistance efflux pump
MTISSLPAARAAAALLMVGTIGGSVLLLTRAELRSSPAFVDEDRREVGTTERGRLARLLVDVGDQVREGDVIARLDTSLIDAEIAAAEAEASALANRARARAHAAGRAATELRGRADEVEEAARAARSKAAALRVAVEEVAAQVGRGLAGGEELPGLRAEIATAEAEARSLEASASMLRAAQVGDGPGLLTPDEAAQAELDLVQRRVEALRARRDLHELRATVDGRVAVVQRRQGDALEPGDGVVEVVAGRASRAIACVDARYAAGLRVDQAARLRPVPGGQPIDARVVSIGVAFEEADPRCRLGLYQPAWVLPVVLTAAAGEALLPGAPLEVQWLDALATGVGPDARVEQTTP